MHTYKLYIYIYIYIYIYMNMYLKLKQTRIWSLTFYSSLLVGG